jgi:HD-GYP domain-containing protein (c-di-GMP phosphodiesterase class II)/serine/threonine protein phosphatase PrpC
LSAISLGERQHEIGLENTAGGSALKAHKKSYRVIVLGAMAGGVALMGYLNLEFGSRAGDPQSLPTLLLWIALVSIAVMSPIPLLRGRTTIDLAPALDLGAILVFGPVAACYIAILSRVIAHMGERWSGPFPVVFRVGQSLLSIGVAGLVLAILSGQEGPVLTEGGWGWVPVIAAAGVYLLVKTFFDTLEAKMTSADIESRSLRFRIERVVPFELGVLAFGVLLALTETRIGPVGVALILVPIFVTRYAFKLWIDARKAHLLTVRTLMNAVDAADPFTWGHSYRISKVSVRIGKELGMSLRDLEELEYAALLHDIGRTAIKREILIKPGRLTDKEQSVLRTHPRIGHEIVSGIKFFHGAGEIIFSHHEQPDGNGYPRGLKGEEIPVGSRIIMAVSAFDAMTSDRPYRRGLTPAAAFDELRELSGTQFFSDVVESVISLYDQGKLFEEFDEEVLTQYFEGRANSRALDEFFAKTGMNVAVPEKLGLAEAEEETHRNDIPIIEFPIMKPSRNSIAKEILIDSSQNWKLTAAGLSDVGCRRDNNEDSFGIFDDEDPSRGCLLIVADGMGGHAAGEVASAVAVETVEKCYMTGEQQGSASDSLRASLEEANRAIREKASGDREMEGMGTTCTAVSIVGSSLIYGHVGDSRAYMVKANSIEMLTEDHTLAAELVGMGGTGKVAGQSASSVLTRSLGSDSDVRVDVAPEPIALTTGTAVVLCSDGLSNVIDDKEIADIVNSESPGDACETMVDLARARGGPDNITVVVGRVDPV